MGDSDCCGFCCGGYVGISGFEFLFFLLAVGMTGVSFTARLERSLPSADLDRCVWDVVDI